MKTWHATHRITFTPISGPPQTWLVMLDECAACTKSEWENEIPADWEVIDGAWLFRGDAAPGNGNIEIVEL